MAIQELDVLTKDGLRTYTETLVAWIKSKLDVKTEENLSLGITPEFNGIKISLFKGETEHGLVTIPIVSDNKAGLISPTMRSQIDSLIQGGEGSYVIQDLVDGTNILPTAMELGYIYVKDGKLYIPITNPNGSYYNVIEIGKDGIKNVTNTKSSELYIPTLLNPSPSECESRAEEMGFTRGFIFYDTFNICLSVYDAVEETLTRYGINEVTKYEKAEDVSGATDFIWNIIEEEEEVIEFDNRLDDESENAVQNKVITQVFDEYSGRLGSIDNDITNIENNISYLDGNITTIGRKVDNINIQSVQEQLTDLSGFVDQINENVSDNASDIATIKGDIEDINNILLSDIETLKGIAIEIDEMSDSGYYFNFNSNTLIKTNNGEEINEGYYLLTLASEGKYYIFNANEKVLTQLASKADIDQTTSLLQSKASLSLVEDNIGKIITLKFMGDPSGDNFPILRDGDYYLDTTRNILYRKTTSKSIIPDEKPSNNKLTGTRILEFQGNYFLFDERLLLRIITNEDDIIDSNSIVDPWDFTEWNGGIITVKYWDETEDGVPPGMLFAPGSNPRNPGYEVGDYMYDSSDNSLLIYTEEEGWVSIDNNKHIICNPNENTYYIWTPGEGEPLERIVMGPIENIYVKYSNEGDPQLLQSYSNTDGQRYVIINLSGIQPGEESSPSDNKIIYPAWNPYEFDPNNDSGDPGDYVFITEGNLLYKYTTEWELLTTGNYFIINQDEITEQSETILVNILYLLILNEDEGNTLTRIANFSDVSEVSSGGIIEIRKNNGTKINPDNGVIILPDYLEQSALQSYYSKTEIDSKLSNCATNTNLKNAGKAVYVSVSSQNITVQSSTFDGSIVTNNISTSLIINDNRLLLKVDNVGQWTTPKYYSSWTATSNLLQSTAYTNLDLYYSIEDGEITFWKRDNNGFTSIDIIEGLSEQLDETTTNVENLLLNSKTVKVIDPVGAGTVISGDNNLGKYQLTFNGTTPVLKQYLKVNEEENQLVDVTSGELYLVQYNNHIYSFRKTQGGTNWDKLINDSDLSNLNNKKIFKVIHSGTGAQAGVHSYELGDAWYSTTGNKIYVYTGASGNGGFEEFTIPSHDSVLLYFVENEELKLFKDGELITISVGGDPQEERVQNTVDKIVICNHWGEDPGVGTEGYWYDEIANKIKIYNSNSEQWEETTTTQNLLSEDNLYINTLLNEIYRYKNNLMTKLSARSISDGQQSGDITDATLNEILAELAEKLSVQAERLNQLSIETNEINSDSILQMVKRTNAFVLGSDNLNKRTSVPLYGQIGDIVNVNSQLMECTQSSQNAVVSIRIKKNSDTNTYQDITIPLVTKNIEGELQTLVTISGITMKNMANEEEMANYLCDQIAQKGYRKLDWSYDRTENNAEIAKYPKSVCVSKTATPYYYVKIVPEYFGDLVNDTNSQGLGDTYKDTGSARSRYIQGSGNMLIYFGVGSGTYNSSICKNSRWNVANFMNNLSGYTLPDNFGIKGQCFFWEKYNIPVWSTGAGSSNGSYGWRDATGQPVSNDEDYKYVWERFKPISN